ncbi:MAG TPA: 2-hydroxyhepta-2,4-diene-1,7-dioate isomerase [Bacteroidetes bacterium]|jgi:acylpyruvate hydrolase|nr:2-hydroxyhepta-2,4-diene-1,7-dioate isomerase [Bacteroidota bacterium]
MKCICIGRNYGEHAKELNNPVPENPVVFLKPSTAVLHGKDFYHPEFSNDIHYECELLVRIGKQGKHIAKEFAHHYIDALSVGIDFTARDVQARQKEKGLPWEIAKAFDQSAVVGQWVTWDKQQDLTDCFFGLQRNQQWVQQGNSRDMLFPITDIIHYVSRYFTLQQGDVLFTGTPAGVGKINIGDHLEGYLLQQKLLEVFIK